MDSPTAPDVPAAAHLVSDGRAVLGDAASLLAEHGIESSIVAVSDDGNGLTLCERLVERHDGEIRVPSEPADVATFSFTVPAEGVRNE